MPKVSVITVFYNGRQTLAETIKSILSQTYEDFEYFLIDNGSTDNSSEIVKSFDDPRIIYKKIPKNTGSPVAGRNLAIREAGGGLIGFCDSDDIWYPQKLEIQTSEFEKNPKENQTGIIFSAADIIDKNGKIIKTRKTPFAGYLKSKESFAKMAAGNFITACSALFPKKMIEELGELDETLLGTDEYEFWLRLTQRYGVLAIPEPLCAWRETGENFSANKKNQYLKTDKILERFKGPEAENGRGKNLLRIILASVLEKDFITAAKARKSMKKYPLSKKGKALIWIYDLSPKVAFGIFTFLKAAGVISL